MSKSIYLIEPKANFPNYHSAEVVGHLGFPPFAYIADLILTTVAAFVPDDFEVTLCDEQISAADLDHPANFVGITGKSGQVGRMIELAQAFRRRGKVVLIGGPYASLVPEFVRPYCDILVRGEIEAIAPKLFDDLRKNRWQAEYVGGQPDLSLSPLPRWDLYPNDRAISGCVQTARGCPFECEFCDVIQYAGRKQRHKPIDQILAELDLLYKYGYRAVFIADDNFTVYRRRAKELLNAIKDWNRPHQVAFSTQLSIDIATDDEILQLCAEAGLRYVFIGLETPNEESLREVKKRQNVGINMLERIQRFLAHGIGVMGGMIVGFDADGPDIFERQYKFAMASSVPIFSMGTLVAPEATPLYTRMEKANRLSLHHHGDYGASPPPWVTNIIPKQMSREELFTGMRWLGNQLYHPDAFEQRLLQFVDNYKETSRSLQQMRQSQNAAAEFDSPIALVIEGMLQRGLFGADKFSKLLQVTEGKPFTRAHVMYMLFQYAQIRYMYEHGQFWEPHLAQLSAPHFETHPELKVINNQTNGKSSTLAQSRPETLVDVLCEQAQQRPDKRLYTFLQDDGQAADHLTFAELEQQARAIALHLQEMAPVGSRALLLYPPGLDFIKGLFACLYAGMVAVPLYPPRRNRPDARLLTIVKDTQATLALTNSPILSELEHRLAQAPDLAALKWLATDTIGDKAAEDWQAPPIQGDALALLQYTSGSTTTPRGVMLTHRNLLHNLALIHTFFETTSDSQGVFWLPPYHDSGLIGGILEPLYCGAHNILMSPLAFLQNPFRWLQTISDTQATISGGPNFAYDLCLQQITPEQRATLDLSSWQLAFNGAEPVQARTLAQFSATFAACGFRPEAFYPCYGLAEATIMVSGGKKAALPLVRTYQKTALVESRVIETSVEAEDTRSLVGCGHTASDQQVIIVNPQSRTRCAPDEIGEIWVSGPSVAPGYWQRPEETEAIFQAHLADTGAGPFLRTGDLGFLREGELFVTGRLKDLIIIRGRNHYPEDIELTVEQSHPALPSNSGAAFSIEVEGQERLVIMIELKRSQRHASVEEVAAHIRAAIAREHELEVYAVVLLRPGHIPRTSSGKIQRYACRTAFLQETLPTLGVNIQEFQSDLAGPLAPVASMISSEETHPDQLRLEADLQAKLADLLKVSPAQIDLDKPIYTLGLGSLAAVAIKRHVETNLNLELPVELLFEEISLRQLIKRILAERALPAASFETSQPVKAKSPEISQPPTAIQLDDLSQQPLNKILDFSLLFFAANEAEFSQDKYQLLIEAAKFADRHDFAAVWLPERHFHAFGGLYPDPATLAAALAMVTQRIRLRAGSVVLPLNNPIRVAEQWSVVDNLSQGRVDLSFAVGWNPNDFVLAPQNYENRLEVTFKEIQTVQRLWQGEKVAFTNGVGQQKEVQLYPLPQQKNLNIWLTCSGGPQRFIDAGARGYNVLTALLFQTVDELAEKVNLYREARVKHGFDPETGQVTLMLHTYIGQTMEDVRAVVRLPFIEYLKTSTDLWRQKAQPLDELSETERQEVLDFAFERYFQTSALLGTPETCTAMLTNLQNIGINEIACLIDFGVDVPRVMEGLQPLNQLKTQRRGAITQPLTSLPHTSYTSLV